LLYTTKRKTKTLSEGDGFMAIKLLLIYKDNTEELLDIVKMDTDDLQALRKSIIYVNKEYDKPMRTRTINLEDLKDITNTVG